MSGIIGSKLNHRGSGRIAKLGTDGQVLTSSGAGVAAAFEAASGGGTSWQSVETGSTFSAVAGNGYPVNTTAQACTVTLPASASVGDTIEFTDYARTWGTNAVTINQNSLKFQGYTSPNPSYATNGQHVTIVYADATQGWVPTEDDAVAMQTPQTASIEYLCVAGGAGGGYGHYAGGGGAGGYLAGTQAYTQNNANVITVTVGTGGAGSSGATSRGTNGVDSSIADADTEFATLTSVGGGGGGSRNSSSSGGAANGADGGSGGGAGYHTSSGGSATAGQGYAGGDCDGDQYGSGGGGASEVGAVGVDAVTEGGGTGGDGLQNDIVETGTNVYYAGGGGGGTWNTDLATVAGGQGGGGNGGSTYVSTVPIVGTDGLGGGGGGGGHMVAGADGGNGVVILRMLTSVYSGTYTNAETPTTDGSYTILKFLATGTYTID